MHHSHSRICGVVLAISLLALGGCTDDDASSDAPAATGAATADSVGPPSEGSAPEKPGSEAGPETGDVGTSVTTAETSLPSSTTEPPPPEPTTVLTTHVLRDGVQQATMRRLGDATASADGNALIVVGDEASAPGEPERGFVASRDFATDERSTVSLSAGDGFESSAAAATVDGERVLVVGSTLDDDGNSSAMLWSAPAVGEAFDEPETVLDDASRATDIVAWDGGMSIVSIVDDDGAFGVMVSTRTAAEPWQHTPIDLPGVQPSVGGIVRLGDRLVLTAGSVVNGVETPMSWTSDDGGTTFVAHADPVLAESNRIGEPSVIDGELWAVTTRVGSRSSRLAQSSDGESWRAIDLDVERRGVDLSLVDDTPGEIVEFEGRLAFGTFDVLGAMAFVDRSGRGTAHFAVVSQSSLFDVPIPVVVQGRLWAVADSHTDWLADIWSSDSEIFTLGNVPGGGADGPVPTGVTLSDLSDEVAATAFTFPVVESDRAGNISWRREEQWLTVSDDDTWDRPEPGEIPIDAELVASDGDLEIATVSVADDPLDDDVDGPRGGTRVYFRESGGRWLLEDGVLLSGPGAEDANDVVATGDGFLLVGDSSNRTANGERTATPILKEFVDRRWIDLPIASDLGGEAVLSSVAQSETGARVATGSYVADGRRLPLVLAPDADGAWTIVELPGATPELSVVDLVGATESIELVAQDGSNWVLYSSVDGRDFESTPIDLGPASATVQSALDVDGDTVLVGTTNRVGARTLAVWRVADGAVEAIELPDAPFGRDLSVTDAVVDTDGSLLIGAVLRYQSLVIEVSVSRPTSG